MNRKVVATAVVIGIAVLGAGAGVLGATLSGDERGGSQSGIGMPVPGSNVGDTVVADDGAGVSMKVPVPGYEGSVEEMVVHDN